ncbi:MAG: hypothetical protein ACFB9N_11190 [Geitlerinemataceae cyanobacterium]
MTAEFPAIVRFKRALAITLILSGGGIFFSSTLAFLTGQFPFGFIASFAFIFAGVTLQKNTYFRLDRRELVVYKPTGKEDYRCALTSVRDLEIEDDTVYIDRDGESRKMPLYRWLAEDEDWENFAAIVTMTDEALAKVPDVPADEPTEDSPSEPDAAAIDATDATDAADTSDA